MLFKSVVAAAVAAASLAFIPAVAGADPAVSGSEFAPGGVVEISETGKIVTYRDGSNILRHRDLASGADVALTSSLVRGDGRFEIASGVKAFGALTDNIVVTDTLTGTSKIFDLEQQSFLVGDQSGYSLLNIEDASSNGGVVLFRIGKTFPDGKIDARLWAWHTATGFKFELDAVRPRTSTGANATSGAFTARVSDDGSKVVFGYSNQQDSSPGVGCQDPEQPNCLFEAFYLDSDGSDRVRLDTVPGYVSDVAISGDGRVAAFQSFGRNNADLTDWFFRSRVYVRDMSVTNSSLESVGTARMSASPAYNLGLDTTGDRVAHFEYRPSGSSIPQPVVTERSTGRVIDATFPIGGTPSEPATYVSMSRNGEWLVYATATKSYVMYLGAGVPPRQRRLAANSPIEVIVGGKSGVPADAGSVVMNVTAVGASAAGFLTVWPCGTSMPLTSNLNFNAGEDTPNLVISKLGTSGKVCLLSSAAVDVIIDVSGYFPAGSPFVGLSPDRKFDSRRGAAIKVGAGQEAVASVTGMGVPADAAAVVMNLTATGTEADGFVTSWPCGTDRPTASSLNFRNGSDRANLVLAKVGTSGTVCLFTSGTTHLIADVAGYFPAGATYIPVAPDRLVDTRFSQPVAAGGTLEVAVPAGNKAVALNVTVTGAAAAGFATVFPCGEAVPSASNLNYQAGRDIPNAVIVKVGAGTKICVFSDKQANYIVDLSGGFPTASTFAPLSPTRLLDTR